MAKPSTKQAPSETIPETSDEDKRHQIFLTDEDRAKADMLAAADLRTFPKFMKWLLNKEWASRHGSQTASEVLAAKRKAA